MEVKDVLINTSAARMVASTFGLLAGLGGITHGVGQILQGNVAPGGIIVNSWTEGPIATNMGGEPGMTIVPNLLVTGILTLIFSLAVLVWAALFVQRKNGGRILIALSIAMLLVGGGTGIVVRQATVYVPGSSGGRVTKMTWGSAGSTWLSWLSTDSPAALRT